MGRLLYCHETSQRGYKTCDNGGGSENIGKYFIVYIGEMHCKILSCSCDRVVYLWYCINVSDGNVDKVKVKNKGKEIHQSADKQKGKERWEQTALCWQNLHYCSNKI